MLGLLTLLAVGTGLSFLGSAASSGIQYASNKALQEDAQAFNAEEAQKARDFTAQENQLSRDFNAAEAEKARDWSKMMSDTQYSRQVADMKRAGLNVGAMSSSVSGAAVPSASTGTSVASQGSNAASSGMNSISSPIVHGIDRAIGSLVQDYSSEFNAMARRYSFQKLNAQLAQINSLLKSSL